MDKNGKPKDNFTPGYELRAKVTVLAEGPRGSLTKELVNNLKLDGLNPQVYGIGIKELWDVQPGRIETGFVAHTLGWPLQLRYVRRRLDLRHARQSRLARHGRRASNITTRFSIRTKRFKNSRRIRSSRKFWKAASSFATARKPFRTAAGIPCRATTWTAASSSAIPPAC